MCVSELVVARSSSTLGLIEYIYSMFGCQVTIFLYVCLQFVCVYRWIRLYCVCTLEYIVYVYNYVQYLLAREHSRQAYLVI